MSIEHSQELKDLAAALAKAQAAVKGALRDSSNPHYKSKYADLESVWDACRKPLTDNGLSVSQWPGRDSDGAATLTTMLLHSSGQWIKGTASTALSKNDAQGVGSALTYLRRYALAAVASVAPEDDDGNAASQRSEGQASGSTSQRAENRSAHAGPVLPGKPSSWDGHGGKLLTEVPTPVLQKAAAWLLDKGDPKNDGIIAAIEGVVEARRVAAKEAFDNVPGALADTDEDLFMDRHLSKAGK